MTSNNLLNTDGPNEMTRGRHGRFVYNRNDAYVGRSLQRYGEYSEGEVELFGQICRSDDIVVEVGANIGAHTVPLARLVPDGGVFAFEPQRLGYYCLYANVALNSLANVFCYQLAAGSHNGPSYIENVRYDRAGNFGGVAVHRQPAPTRVEAQTVKLDDFATLPRLRLLKVDVEGMETDVIEGSRDIIQQHRPLIYVENDRPEQSPALIELIQSLDYRMHWHVTRLFSPHNFRGDKEDIFPTIFSFNMLCVPCERSPRMAGFIEVQSAEEHPLDADSRFRRLHSNLYRYQETE